MRPSVLRVGPKPSAWYPESRVRGHRDAWVGWPRGMEADTGAMQTREVMQTQGWCRHGGDADTGVTQTRKVIQTLGWCRHGRWYRHRGDADMRGDTDTGVMQTREVIQTLGWCRHGRWYRHWGDADTRGDTDTAVMQTWGDAAAGRGHLQPPKAGRDKEGPSLELQGSAALSTPWYRLLASRTKRTNFFVLSHLVCGVDHEAPRD